MRVDSGYAHGLDAGLDDLAVVVVHLQRDASVEVRPHRLANMGVVVAKHVVEVSQQDYGNPLSALMLLDVARGGLDLVDVVPDGGGQVGAADLEVERSSRRGGRDVDDCDGPPFSMSYFSWPPR